MNLKIKLWSWTAIAAISGIVIALPTVFSYNEKLVDLFATPAKVDELKRQVTEMQGDVIIIKQKLDSIERHEWGKPPRQIGDGSTNDVIFANLKR